MVIADIIIKVIAIMVNMVIDFISLFLLWSMSGRSIPVHTNKNDYRVSSIAIFV
jgi:hypothetical protein